MVEKLSKEEWLAKLVPILKCDYNTTMLNYLQDVYGCFPQQQDCVVMPLGGLSSYIACHSAFCIKCLLTSGGVMRTTVVHNGYIAKLLRKCYTSFFPKSGKCGDL